MFNTRKDASLKRDLRDFARNVVRRKKKNIGLLLTDIRDKRPTMSFRTPGMMNNSIPDYHQKTRMNQTTRSAIERWNTFTATVIKLKGDNNILFEKALIEQFQPGHFITPHNQDLEYGKYQPQYRYEILNGIEIPSSATAGRRCFLQIDSSYQIMFYLVKTNESVYIVLRDPVHLDLIKCVYPVLLTEEF